MSFIEQYLLQLNTQKRRWCAVVILTALSLVVALVTIWNLRMTGITIANGAACGYAEHQHTEACSQDGENICGLAEHIHKVECYSNTHADVETAETWEATLPKLTGNIGEDVVLIAQSQLGYTESTENYELADDGITKNGITRYGQWYGNPYGNWSNMFTSFCLRYAGIPESLLNSGAKVMKNYWEQNDRYRGLGKYDPAAGDIVFLDKNQNGEADTTAIILSWNSETVTVIEGDVDNQVVKTEYDLNDGLVMGYGISAPEHRLMMFAAAPTATGTIIGSTATYNNNLLTQGGSFIIYTTASDGTHYALDGNGNAVEIQIDGGTIYADVSDANSLYWTFTKTDNYDNKPAYYIQNASTGRYLHPNRDSSTYGPIHPDQWEAALYTSGSGVRIRGARQDAYVQLSGSSYTISNTQDNGSVMYFGKAPTALNLWLDGTNGDLMAYRGSDNTKHTVYSGVKYQLPSQWKSPDKYSYKLAGWVNIETGDYYLPGADITITKDTVLYADWVAATYDIGQYNAYVANTVSTNDFISTKLFDYSSLINLLSTKVSITVSGSSHSETWSHVGSGAVSYKGQNTLNFSFNDHDGSGDISNPNNRNDANNYTGGTGVYAGIYNTTLGDVLFSTENLFNPATGTGIVGKHYLGEGDHLFQINTDPDSEYYGYYYYDAKLNAASYNQTDQRFYVYEHLARTSDSAGNNDAGKYSDFLPLNSPYVNTNGQPSKTYSYAGENGEYSGVSHYEYDARYNSDEGARANLWFGMRTDVQFGLAEVPGRKLPNGEYGNKDLYGKDMHFKFTGDDDVWILVDGKVVLDLGGIHQAAEGDINFSTGEVRVNGSSAGTLSGIGVGEHTLTILYLERGSSMSNCAIYFNLAPRFSLTLQKEDVLTQEVLNGAQFAVYNDLECTDPCDLWGSYQSYKNGDEPTNVFTVVDGKATIWGLSPSRVYYIKETSPPNVGGYSPSKGVIQLTLDKNGLNSYSAVIVDGIDSNGNKIPVSHGFTLHGFRIDEENQAAYIVITNAQNWVTETTSVYVEKKWNDNKDHTGDAVTVYLNVIDSDGTVRRIREIALSEENDWQYSWTNLPKYTVDSETMLETDVLVNYSVSEAYIQGYSPSIETLENGTYTEESWSESKFVNGEKFLLQTSQGYLSTVAANSNTLCFVDEQTAKNSDLALWTATVSSERVKLTNQAGQSLNYQTSGVSTRYFNATTGTSNSQSLYFSGETAVRLYYRSGRSYYFSGLNQNNYGSTATSSNSGLTFYPMVKTVTTTVVDLDGYGFSITNTPLKTETSLTVVKQWDYPEGDASFYEKEQVTLRLYANGVDTGRTETVSLKSNWKATFQGLPYLDDEENPIVYTVVETWETEDWIPSYGPVVSTSADVPTYETIVTNHYRWGQVTILPSTGGIGTSIYILFGLVLVISPFVYGLSLRRRYGRRFKG